jgi:hypothetical protein
MKFHFRGRASSDDLGTTYTTDVCTLKQVSLLSFPGAFADNPRALGILLLPRRGMPLTLRGVPDIMSDLPTAVPLDAPHLRCQITFSRLPPRGSNGIRCA